MLKFLKKIGNKKLNKIQKQCKHKINCFGKCRYCDLRIKNFEYDHEHKFIKYDDDNEWCSICGETYKDLININTKLDK